MDTQLTEEQRNRILHSIRAWNKAQDELKEAKKRDRYGDKSHYRWNIANRKESIMNVVEEIIKEKMEGKQRERV